MPNNIPEQPDQPSAKGHNLSARAWRLCRSSLHEAHETGLVTWRHAVRLGGYGRGQWARWLLERKLKKAILALGVEAYAAKVGDQGLRDRIAALDAQVLQDKTDKKPTLSLWRERHAIFLKLANDVLKTQSSMTSVDAEIQGVEAAQKAIREHETRIEQQWVNLPCRDAIEKRRVGIGYGTAGCLVLLGLVLMTGAGNRKPTRAGQQQDGTDLPPLTQNQPVHARPLPGSPDPVERQQNLQQGDGDGMGYGSGPGDYYAKGGPMSYVGQQVRPMGTPLNLDPEPDVYHGYNVNADDFRNIPNSG